MATIMNNSGIQFDDNTTQASRSDYVMRVYTSPATWDKPTALKSVKVTTLAGGGSGGAWGGPGGGGAGGGAGGGYATGYFPAPAIIAPLTVTVGAGAARTLAVPTSYSNGNAGGTSSFGTLMSVTGGAGGAAGPGTLPAGAAGGSGTTSASVLAVAGQSAAAGFNTFSPGADGALRYGFGGVGRAGAGGINGPGPAGDAAPGTGYGSGGGGHSGPQSFFPTPFAAQTVWPSTSGAGTPGFVIVEEFY